MLTTRSRQIRPPIYSIKQSRLRKRRVIRYATLYFVLLVLFILLFFGPIIVAQFIDLKISIPLDLMQPTGQNNNDTFSSVTGNALGNFGQDGGAAATGGGGGGNTGGSGDTATSSDDSGSPFSFGGRMAVRWATIA